MDSSHGYSPYQYGGQYIPEQSTLEKITAKVYQAKLKVQKTLKKPEDEHLVASDAELDAKLETYRHVQRSCAELQSIVNDYATRIYALSQAENELGRFLKQQGERDKTRAGKMMQATGKSLSCASQQRLALRVPLTRLGSEVETFANRAVRDCDTKIMEMEAARTNYRGSLLWMKDVSERLDPEAYNRLEKFRKVQMQVKRAKERFDKQKLDSMQKVDLLVASRCNMFSRVLVLYEQTIVQFSHKTARIMCAVADAFQGYQYFEFNMLRELTDCTRKLARETSGRGDDSDDDDADDFDNGEQTLREVESKLSSIVGEANAAGAASQSETDYDADSLQLPNLGGAFSFGLRERDRDARTKSQEQRDTKTKGPDRRNKGMNVADQVEIDDDFEDPTKLYEYIRRNIFEQKAASNANAKPGSNAMKLKTNDSKSLNKGSAKPMPSNEKKKEKGANSEGHSQSNSAVNSKRRGPIRDDADIDANEETPDFDASSPKNRGDPNPDIALEKLDELFAKEYSEDSDPFAEGIDLSVPSKTAGVKPTDAKDAAASLASATAASGNIESLLFEEIDLNVAPTDVDRAFLSDLFGMGDGNASGEGAAPLMASEFANIFETTPNATKSKGGAVDNTASLGDDDPWKAFSAALPSHQIGSISADQVSPLSNSSAGQLMPSGLPLTASASGMSRINQNPGEMFDYNQFTKGTSLVSAMPQQLSAGVNTGVVPGIGTAAMAASLNMAAAGNKAPMAGAAIGQNLKKDAPAAPPLTAKKEELAAWFNMFADLDPLANPDKLGRKPGHDDAFNEA